MILYDTHREACWGTVSGAMWLIEAAQVSIGTLWVCRIEKDRGLNINIVKLGPQAE